MCQGTEITASMDGRFWAHPAAVQLADYLSGETCSTCAAFRTVAVNS
jgi:hypothetical protein